MAWSLVASAINGGATTLSTSAINTTGATLIAIFLGDFQGATIATISDSQSNTWTKLTSTLASNNIRGTWYYCLSPTTNASHTFTATISGSTDFPSIYVGAWSNTGNVIAFDKQTGNHSTTTVTSQICASLTPSTNGALILAGLANDAGSSCTVNQSFTIDRFVNYSNGLTVGAYLAQTTAAALTPTFSWTTAGDSSANLIAFKIVPPAGGLFLPNNLTGLGSGGPFFNDPIGLWEGKETDLCLVT